MVRSAGVRGSGIQGKQLGQIPVHQPLRPLCLRKLSATENLSASSGILLLPIFLPLHPWAGGVSHHGEGADEGLVSAVIEQAEDHALEC